MTITDEKLIEVQNLTDYQVGYTVPEIGTKRGFMPQQTRKIAAGELRAVHAGPGGETLFADYLAVKDAELAAEFDITTDVFEHEYNWTQENVDTVLQYGSIDALKDALDYAPAGIIDLIIDRAIALQIPDNNKLAAITESTGHDIASMIQLKKSLQDTVQETKKPSGRRVTSATTKPSGRRVTVETE